MTDEQRTALYLDGGMAPDERAGFEREMAARPELAALVVRWRANDERLRAAFDLPMPADLAGRLGLEPPAPAITDLAAARADRERRRRLPAGWTWVAGGAIAASLVAALSLGLVSPLAGPADPLASEGFQAAMQSMPSRQAAALSDGGSVTPILSFTDGGGRFCREFALGGDRPRVGVACRSGGRWRVVGTAAGEGASADDGGIRTAGGAGASLDPIYRRLDAGDPLDPARERRLIESGWPEAGARRE